MKTPARVGIPFMAAVLGLGAVQEPAKEARPFDGPRLEISKAVACSKVGGFEDYVPMPEPKLTSEDKLKVYFRPQNFKIEPSKSRYRAKLTEDGRVRRKGEKAPISKEEKLLEFEETFDTPIYQIYLVNTIGLKNLPPGDYEFDIILHDALVEGSSTTKTIPFTIIPTPKADEPAEPDPSEKKSAKKGKPARPSKPKG